MLFRTILAAALTSLSLGCATGLPAGARLARVEGYEPFARPAKGNPVPEFDEAQAVPLALAPESVAGQAMIKATKST